MIPRVRRSAIPIIALCLLSAAPAIASGGHNRVVGNCRQSQVKPKEIILACADVNLYVDKIKWQSFGAAKATGSGTYVENTCTPNCAAGKYKSYPVSLTLSNAKPCFDRQNDYRKMAVTFTAAAPPPGRKSVSEQLFCPVG